MESHQLQGEEETGSGIWLAEEQVFVTVDTSASNVNTNNNSTNIAPSIITVEPFILTEDANVNRVFVNGNLYPPSNAVPLPLQTTDIINGNERNSVSATVVSCTSCSTTFDSGDTFFQHWVEKHCKVEAQAEDERCKNCDQIIIDPVTKKKLDVHVCNNQKRPQKRKSEETPSTTTKGKKS